MDKYRLILKTIIVSAVVIGTNVFGNYVLKLGLSHGFVGDTWSPMTYIRAFGHPWVTIGTVFLTAWFVTRLALLSWADLSYVLPVTSFSCALSAGAGALFMGEHVTGVRWLGICLITLGVAFTAFTFPETTPIRSEIE